MINYIQILDIKSHKYIYYSLKSNVTYLKL